MIQIEGAVGGRLTIDVVVAPTLAGMTAMDRRIVVISEIQPSRITVGAALPDAPAEGDIRIPNRDVQYTLAWDDGNKRLTVQPGTALQYTGSAWVPRDAYLGIDDEWVRISTEAALDFTYTGDYEERVTTYGGVRYNELRLLTSGVLTSLSMQTVDAFLVGGGGGAGMCGGGGGGYTATYSGIQLPAVMPVVIGAGGVGNKTTSINTATDGGHTQIINDNYRVLGGKHPTDAASGNAGEAGHGGSGGGWWNTQPSPGGSDGSDGSAGYGGHVGGTGQGRTTRAFGHAGGELFSGGGGGGSNATSYGGAGGGGQGSPNVNTPGFAGATNTGGGGGGGWGLATGPGYLMGGDGGSGIVILRWPT